MPSPKSLAFVMLSCCLLLGCYLVTTSVSGQETTKQGICSERAWPTSITFFSLNVWFSHQHAKLRTDALVHKIRELDPDVVALQEVTGSVAGTLQAQLGDTYLLSDPGDGSSFTAWYGTETLVHKRLKPSLKGFRRATLPGNQGRVLLISDFHFSSSNTSCASDSIGSDRPSLSVANLHLESLDYHYIREQQLNITRQHLNSADSAVALGDFNFDDDANHPLSSTPRLENLSLSECLGPSYADVWEHIHPSERGLTFDTNRNHNAEGKREERARYDRIVASTRASPLEVHTIQIVADSAVEPGIFMSDHFGLLAEFVSIY